MLNEEYYNNLNKDMASKSIESLVEEFNKQVGSKAWSSIRGIHDTVLIDTLIDKGIDVSAVYDGIEISFKNHIALDDDKSKIVIKNND